MHVIGNCRRCEERKWSKLRIFHMRIIFRTDCIYRYIEDDMTTKTQEAPTGANERPNPQPYISQKNFADLSQVFLRTTRYYTRITKYLPCERKTLRYSLLILLQSVPTSTKVTISYELARFKKNMRFAGVQRGRPGG